MISAFSDKKSLVRSKFSYFLSLRKHGFPSLYQLLLPGCRALPLRPSFPTEKCRFQKTRSQFPDSFSYLLCSQILFFMKQNGTPCASWRSAFCSIGGNSYKVSGRASGASSTCKAIKMHLPVTRRRCILSFLLPSVGITQIRYGRRCIFLSACHTGSRA